MVIGERIRLAFSLRRNLRRLFVPGREDLRPLDGLRAISILWLVLFHAGWYIGLHVPIPAYAELVFAPWMLPIWRGDFGVDIFFVLSGFLIAGALIDERNRTGRIRTARFYGRRLTRLWPSLLVVLAVNAMFIAGHNRTALANLLCVSNFVPVARATMGWTWSLSIEEQFYLVCPWLVLALASLRLPARLALLTAIGLALVAIAAWVVHSGSFHALDAEIVVNRSFERWAHAYDHLYDKPWMRAAPLVAGVASAYMYRSRAAMTWFSRHGVLAAAALLCALVVAVVSTHWPLVASAPRGVEVAYLATYRAAFGLAVAYVMLFALSEHPVGRALGSALSWRVLHPFAQLAYSAYLLNPIVTTLADHALAPLVWTGRAKAFPLFLPFDLVGTFLAAMLLYLLVERPFMELRGFVPWLANDPPPADRADDPR